MWVIDMIKEIMHIGITVSNLENSIKFYRDILGLTFVGEMVMEGKETDLLFASKNIKVGLAYLNGSENIIAPPIELIQFLNKNTVLDPCGLTKTSISEICFKVTDIDVFYKHLQNNGVECLSEPQAFDFTAFNFGKSKALYFKDPDGVILELMEVVGSHA